MKRLGLFGSVGFLFVVCGTVFGQGQFWISDFEQDGTMTIEYPLDYFDGAYLFIEANSNLLSNAVWEAVDYTQVDSGKAMEKSGGQGSSIWNMVMDAPGDFFRIIGLSFIDSDGDGVDNVSEYGAGTNPNVSDAPPANLPPDNGDPQPVLGSVNSAPGDWNTPPQSDYHAPVGLHGVFNTRILAMDGTNGTFTAQTPVATLGAWIEAQCGTWVAPAEDETYPTVEEGRFFQTETNGFTWVGKENIYALAFHPHDGSEQFSNHLVQSGTGDPAGLALLTNSTPVLVNASSPWTKEKLEACLPHLVTISCRLQKLNGGAFDTSDTTAMAQGETQINFDDPVPVDQVIVANCFIQVFWSFSGLTGWTAPPTGVFSYSRNGKFTFLDNLAQQGFGTTTHRGYVGLKPPHDWGVINGGWEKYTLQSFFPAGMVGDTINKTFTRTDGQMAWLLAEDTNYTTNKVGPVGGPPGNPPNTGYNQNGFRTYAAEVLSTFSPPPMADAATLVMDFDRDGTIGTNDFNRIDESHPFRFWVNEDGNNAAYPEADLEDFFPAQISWPEGGGAANLTFKLSANIGLDYITTTMTTNDTDAYLTDLTVAGDLSQPVQIQSLPTGTQTGTAFAENTILLLAPSSANATAEIYVHILENGSEILVSTNHFSFSPVADMYRTKNLRAGGIDSPEAPNWPDELTNGKDFVFIHGYNVTESAGHNWNADIFKRLWHSGSNARFNGVLWDGTPPAVGDRYHYHNSVVNAFATAPDFATYLNGLNEPVVGAHSLGNMVASSAICDHGASVEQFYLVDAAVAKEAYGDSTPNDDTTPDGSVIHNQNEGLFSLLGYDWREYPPETWASEWYCLFTNDVNDTRGKLTWRHRFADIQTHTDAFNFYSSTEEVLRVDTGYTSIISSLFDGNLKLYAFQMQELFKGKDSYLANKAGGSDPYTGWGFTTESDTHIYSTPGLDIDFCPIYPSFHRTQLDQSDPARRAAFREILKTDPLFRPEPAELFGAGGDTLAGATIATCGFTFNYDLPDAMVDISAVPVRDYLLAKAFPARTGALGSRPHSKTLWDQANFDMADKYIKPGQWIRTDTYNGTLEWRHSDIRDAAYVYIHKFFDKLTAKEETP